MNRKRVATLIMLLLLILLLSAVPTIPVIAQSDVRLSGSPTPVQRFLPRTTALVCIVFYATINWFALKHLRIFGAPGPPVFIVWLPVLTRVCQTREISGKIMLKINNHLKVFQGTITNLMMANTA